MGSYLYTEGVCKNTVYCEHLGYDTEYCLPGCPEKVRLEGIDTDHQYALQKSSLFTNAVLLYCNRGDDHDLFHNRDIVRLVIYFLLQYSVQERLEKATSLYIPWSIRHINESELYMVIPPKRFLCKEENNSVVIRHIKNRGKTYCIPNSFWLDDVYESLQCPCPLRKDRVARERRAHEQEQLKRSQHIQRRTDCLVVQHTSVPYCRLHNKWGYRCPQCKTCNNDF